MRLITALGKKKKNGLDADATGTAATARTSLSTHYDNLMFGWRPRRGRRALMLSFLPCETSGFRVVLRLAVHTGFTHARPPERACGHAKGWVALTRARNERCDKAKQVAVNCREPPAKPF